LIGLRGAPGSEVVLTVLHMKTKETQILRFPRVPVSPPEVDKPGHYEAWFN
jgi:hypothetical protein